MKIFRPHLSFFVGTFCLMSATTSFLIDAMMNTGVHFVDTCLHESSCNATNGELFIASHFEIETVVRWNNVGVDRLDVNDINGAEHSFHQALSTVFDISCVNLPIHLQMDEASGKSKRRYTHQRTEYDEGMGTGQDPVRIDLTRSSPSTVLSTLLYNMGQIWVRRGEDDKALVLFGMALKYAVHNANSTSHSVQQHQNVGTVAILQTIGRLQYRNSHHQEAMCTFHKALEIAQTKYSETSNGMLEIAAVLNCLGVLYFHMQTPDCETAMQLYNRSLALRFAVLGSDACTLDIATTHNNIGRVHYMRGEYDSAMSRYIEALRIRRQLLGNDHLDVAAIVCNAGQAHHHRGELKEALMMYQEFIRIATSQLGDKHRDVAMVLKCIAQIHHERGEFEPAKAKYLEALEVGRVALGQVHPEIASTLNKLGNLLYERGLLNEAIKVYRTGLKVERLCLDSLHPNIVVTLTNIGQIHRIRGDLHSALRFYQEAAIIQRKTLGSDHSSTLSTLSSIAWIFFQTRSYVKALELYQEVLRVRMDRMDSTGEGDLDIASTLNSIGLVLFKMERYEMALPSLLRSLQIRQQILGHNHKDVAVILYNIGTVYLELGDEDDAISYYRETLRVEQAALGPSHPDVVLTMQHLGLVHQQRGEIKESLQYYFKVLQIQIEADCPASIARTWNHIGNLFLQTGETESMMAAYSESLRELNKIGKSECDLAITGLNFYGLAKIHPECAPVA